MARTDFESGAIHARDYIIAIIVGMQESVNDTVKYSAYQEVMDMIEERLGKMFQDFKG